MTRSAANRSAANRSAANRPAADCADRDRPEDGSSDRIEEISPPVGPDLLGSRFFAAFVRSRWYPRVFQVPVAAVFGLVTYQLLAGPDAGSHNSGTALMWVLWWPLLPVIFVLLGRFWCAVCPFGVISDAVQKLVGVGRPVPRFLKKYGIWIIDAQFLAITWSDHIWGIVESPWGSGILLLLLTTGVIVSGAFFQRRTFCRYLCFLGGLCGNYGRAGLVELRADGQVCATCTSRAACYNGTDTVPGCPMFLFPRTLDSSANCNLCANCVKTCPNDAIAIRLRKPTSELWFVREPKVEEAFLAMAIMGIVMIQNVTMLGIWTDALSWIGSTTGVTDSTVIFTLAFAVAVMVPVALLTGASWLASRRNPESTWTNFARFGYALIPLDIAAHLAHNLFHLLAEGGTVFTTLAELFGSPTAPGSTEHGTGLVGTGTIQVLQFLLLTAGIAASLYAVRRIARGRYRTTGGTAAGGLLTMAPFVTVIVLLTMVNGYLFTLPMSHRM